MEIDVGTCNTHLRSGFFVSAVFFTLKIHFFILTEFDTAICAVQYFCLDFACLGVEVWHDEPLKLQKSLMILKSQIGQQELLIIIRPFQYLPPF